MKPPTTIFRSVLAAVLLAATTVGYANKPARPPQLSDAVGVWSGYSNHYDFLRLDFDKDGSGYLSFISVVRDAPVAVYRVKKWSLSEWNVTLELEPLTRGAEPFQFTRVRCYYHYMECEYGGKRWDRKATLFAERDLKALGERAQKATDEERKKK